MNTKIATILVIISLPLLCKAQPADFLSDSDKKIIIDKVSNVLTSKLLIESDAAKMSSLIERKFDNGEYDSIDNVLQFCRVITRDLRSIKNDKHLFVFYNPDEALEVRAYNRMLPEKESKIIDNLILEAEKKENFGFKELKILNGNIGYLRLAYFSSPKFFDKKVEVAMSFLEDTDALIIDLRDNGGGEGSPLFASYFLPKGEILLSQLLCRDTLQNSEIKTSTTINGRRYLSKSLFILINSNTFSAAESFAYTLKHLKRAVLIGENTKGGAHPVDIINIHGDVLIQLPICKSYNPITKSNWEGIGVIPDIPTPSNKALDIAYIKAIEQIINNTKDESYRAELELLKEDLNNKIKKD